MFSGLVSSTLRSTWPILIMILVTVILFRYFYFKNSRHKYHFHKEALNILFVSYIFILFSVLLKSDLNTSRSINFDVLSEITRYEVGTELFLINVLGNIALFMPLGYFLGYYINSRKLYIPLIVSVIISALVEGIQYFIGRSLDIDDIILNVGGAFIGYIIYLILSSIKERLPNFMQKDGLYNLLCIIIVVVLVVYILHITGVVTLW